jgi:25S rRNA (adenine2142-N1)-methyltransferase
LAILNRQFKFDIQGNSFLPSSSFLLFLYRLDVMPKARKKKTPVTGTSTDVKSSTPQASRTTIRRFHVLLKRRTQLSGSSMPTDAQELAAINREIGEMGGIEEYQRMSAIGQGKDRGGGSEKIFVEWLLELGAKKQTKKIRFA